MTVGSCCLPFTTELGRGLPRYCGHIWKRHNVPKECSYPDAENIAQSSNVKSSGQKSGAVAVQIPFLLLPSRISTSIDVTVLIRY